MTFAWHSVFTYRCTYTGDWGLGRGGEGIWGQEEHSNRTFGRYLSHLWEVRSPSLCIFCDGFGGGNYKGMKWQQRSGGMPQSVLSLLFIPRIIRLICGMISMHILIVLKWPWTLRCSGCASGWTERSVFTCPLSLFLFYNLFDKQWTRWRRKLEGEGGFYWI